MAKKAPDYVLDGMLERIQDSTRLVICSDEPANYADVANVDLADVDLTSGDFSIGAGTPSGRALTVGGHEDEDVDTTGTATHVALVNDDDEELRYVTTCTSQPVTQGNKISPTSWTVTVGQPT